MGRNPYKKTRFICLALVMVLAISLLAMTLIACDEEDDEPENELSFEQVYAYAQEAGYTGTLEELIEAFKGDSAYEIAVKNGYQGSEADWLASLVGAMGKQGEPGKDGTNGSDGKDGLGIAKIEKTSTEGNIDTYTITFTDESTTTFEVANGITPTLPQITIIFDTKGGAIEGFTEKTLSDMGDGKYSATMSIGEAFASLPKPKKDGYTFAKWITGESSEDRQWHNYEPFGTNTTLQAVWNLETYYTRINANGVEDENGDYILFGSYPQSEVTDVSLKSTLTSLAGDLPTETDSKNWTSYEYFNSGSNENDYMWYQDIEKYGETYRGVYFTNYRPYEKQKEGIADNSYQDDYGYYINVIYWFRFEPIKWRILSTSDNEYILISSIVLDSQEYDYNCSSDKSYKNSTIRYWLNNQFYNTAFSSLQQQIINTTNVDNSARSTNTDSNASYFNNGNNSYACENTNDKVYLLSLQESTRSSYGYSTNAYTFDTARRLQATRYAHIQGTWMNYLQNEQEFSGNSNILLRSPSYVSDDRVRQIGTPGYSNSGNYNFVSILVDTLCGIAPVIRIKK